MPTWFTRLRSWLTSDDTQIVDEDVLSLLTSVGQRADTIYSQLLERFHLQSHEYTLFELCGALNRLCDNGQVFKGFVIGRDDRGAQRYWITYRLMPENAEPAPMSPLVEAVANESLTPLGSDLFFVESLSTLQA